MTMKRFISDDDARSLNLFAAFTEVDMTALFDRERSQARFAARNDDNVYNPVRLYEMEVSEDMNAENSTITPYKGGRDERYEMRLTSDDKKLMFDMAEKRGFKSVTDYVLSLVIADAKRK